MCEIIETLSFKGANVSTPMRTIEGACVQDADRLDALGAIGIARTFAYAGKKGTPIYTPDERPTMHDDFAAYKNTKASGLLHFHEKLLLLKDRMGTVAGRRIAEARHAYTKEYVEQFLREWAGEE